MNKFTLPYSHEFYFYFEFFKPMQFDTYYCSLENWNQCSINHTQSLKDLFPLENILEITVANLDDNFNIIEKWCNFSCNE